ncbi:hypothetical protein BgiMline_030766 [Biomphalaria glabrata]
MEHAAKTIGSFFQVAPVCRVRKVFLPSTQRHTTTGATQPLAPHYHWCHTTTGATQPLEPHNHWRHTTTGATQPLAPHSRCSSPR